MFSSLKFATIGTIKVPIFLTESLSAKILNQQWQRQALSQAYALEGTPTQTLAVLNGFLAAALQKPVDVALEVTEPLLFSTGLQIVTVKRARALRQRLRTAVGSAQWRFVVINGTALDAVAANALLKVIEDAPQRTSFFFFAHPKQLLATIRSRCLILRVAGHTAIVAAPKVSLGQALLPNMTRSDRDEFSAVVQQLRSELRVATAPRQNVLAQVLASTLDRATNPSTYKNLLENVHIQVA